MNSITSQTTFLFAWKTALLKNSLLETIVYPTAPTANDSQLMVNVWHAMKSENNDDGSKCVDICQNLHHEYRCVDNCPEQFKIFNETCVHNCPKIAPLSVSIHNYNKNIIEYRCIKSCHKDKLYLNKNSCVGWCEDDYFISNKTCVKKMSSRRPLYLKQLC